MDQKSKYGSKIKTKIQNMDQKSKQRRKALLPGPPTQFSRYVFNDTCVVTSGDETERNHGDYHIIVRRPLH